MEDNTLDVVVGVICFSNLQFFIFLKRARKRSLRGEFFDDRQEVAEEAVPRFGFAQTHALEFSVGGIPVDHGAQALEMPVSVFQVRLDAQAQETVGQAAQVKFGLVMLFTHTGQEDALDSAELPQPFEALEGPAATGTEQGHDLVKIERLRRGEEQPVDLTDRARQREGDRGADKKRHQFGLEWRHGEVAGSAGRFAGRLPHSVKTYALAGRAVHVGMVQPRGCKAKSRIVNRIIPTCSIKNE
jgi:hypothetical protein